VVSTPIGLLSTLIGLLSRTLIGLLSPLGRGLRGELRGKQAIGDADLAAESALAYGLGDLSREFLFPAEIPGGTPRADGTCPRPQYLHLRAELLHRAYYLLECPRSWSCCLILGCRPVRAPQHEHAPRCPPAGLHLTAFIRR
jgi:hypothetical protein